MLMHSLLDPLGWCRWCSWTRWSYTRGGRASSHPHHSPCVQSLLNGRNEFILESSPDCEKGHENRANSPCDVPPINAYREHRIRPNKCPPKNSDFSKGGVHKTDGLLMDDFSKGGVHKTDGFWMGDFSKGVLQNRWVLMGFGMFF